MSDVEDTPVDAEIEDAPTDDLMADSDGEEIGVAKDITGDGGVTKKILVKGTGWERPETGDDVEVHYVGTLEDGTKFDSSRDRPEPFTFKLGVGQVIKAWDKGVASMRKGEKAILVCRGDYAYGAQGSPPKIGPNATLHFEVELLSWKNSKDISPDGSGGIIKSVLAEGKDWAHPGQRDEVLVKYAAYVEGSTEPFAESPDGGQEFTLSEGHLVPALGVALPNMKKEERVSLLVKPQFGFGAEGQPPAVPPNANLKIDLELLSWKKIEDVTSDGSVIKKTLSEGKETWKRPNDGASVTVRYTCRLEDGTVVDQQEARTFSLDDGEVPVGLELAVGKMHKGEHALVTVAPSHGYGEAGSSSGLAAPVPPNSTLTYDVKLSDMKNSPEMWELKDDAEKLQVSLAAKEKGNAAFKAGSNERAIKLYNRAIKFVEVDKTKTVASDLKGPFKDARKSALLNLAAAHLKLADHKEVISSCEKVLEVESTNIKALYRLAQAHLARTDFVEAEMVIKRGLMVEERNTDLLALQKKLKVAAREQNQKESKMFAKMFAPSKSSASGSATAVPTSSPAAPSAPSTEQDAASAGVLPEGTAAEAAAAVEEASGAAEGTNALSEA